MFIEFKKQLGKSVPLEFESSIKFNTLNSDCQNWLNNNELMSPNYPEIYPNNADCEYHIHCESTQHINITFNTFAIEYHGNCS